jgi:hypothetical protein
MALQKIEFKPGINKENTNYSNEGGFYSCDKVRFRSGYPEKLGGWINYSFGNTFAGTTFSLWNWSSLSGEDLIAFGTNQRYYIEYSSQYYPITPVTFTAITTSYTTTANSRKVTILFPAISSISVGTWVTLTGPVAIGSTIVAAGDYEVIETNGLTTISISIPTAATGTTTILSAQTAVFGIDASPSELYPNVLAWGLAPWGGGPWGPLSATSTFNLWSQGNFGQDLVMAVRNGPIYYWAKDTTTFAPAITVNAYANTQIKTSKTATFLGAVSLITVSDSFGINTGAVISGTNIQAGTLVTSAYVPGSTTVPISLPTAGVSAGNYNFSYAGIFAPNQTSQVLVSTVYQFVIAFGSNPYDPTNSSSTFNPMLVRWSDQSNPSEWVPETSNQSGEQALGHGSYLVSAAPTRQEILIWSDTALYTMQYVGAPFIFNFQLLMDNISIISPNAAITVNNVTYWMGVDKFYMYSGQVQTLPCTLRSYVFKNINSSQNIKVVAGTNPAYNEIWWFYPSTGSTNSDSYIIYNYLENIWYYGTLERSAWLSTPSKQNPVGVFSIQNSYLPTTMPVGGVILSSIDTSITVVDAGAYPPSGIIIIDNEQISYLSIVGNTFTDCVRGVNGTTPATHAAYAPVTYYVPNQLLLHEYGFDNASVSAVVPAPIYAYIETADFDIEDGQNYAFVYRMLPDFTFQGSTAETPSVMLTVKPRTNSGTAYTTPVDSPIVENTVKAPIPPATYPIEQFTGQVYTRVRGRQMAFRIDSEQLGVTWQMGSMRFDMRTDGRRA